jgi:hypothetical protein
MGYQMQIISKPLQPTSKMLGTDADGEGNSGISQALTSPPIGSF